MGRTGRQANAAMWLKPSSWPAILRADLISLRSVMSVFRYLSRNIKRKQPREKLISDLARQNDSIGHGPSYEE